MINFDLKIDCYSLVRIVLYEQETILVEKRE